MGRINTKKEREETLQWALKLKEVASEKLEAFSFANIKNEFYDTLKNYFALACLSRNKNESADLVRAANKQVFRVRTLVEQAIEETIFEWLKRQNGSRYLQSCLMVIFLAIARNKELSVRNASDHLPTYYTLCFGVLCPRCS